ncbi:MAG: 3'(2'),5'-bisphosphate nucleotidase CysQ [Acidimicrobiia bacterium]
MSSFAASPTGDDHRLARELAAGAGALLLALRAEGGRSADELRAAGDRRAHVQLAERLAAARPGDTVFSEEAADDLGRLDADRVWIIDPLDGTREFGEPGRADWAVHVALVVGGIASVGAVALPALGVVYATDDPPTVPPRSGWLRVVTSRTRRPPETARIAAALGAEVVLLGSAGAKAMAVVRGDADVYAHAGGQYQWDSAAPVAVAAAAGLHVSRLDGSPLVYNGPDPALPDLLVCRPELAAACLAAV